MALQLMGTPSNHNARLSGGKSGALSSGSGNLLFIELWNITATILFWTVYKEEFKLRIKVNIRGQKRNFRTACKEDARPCSRPNQLR